MAKQKNTGASIKRPRCYQALRSQGATKEKAARIANTPSDKIDHDSREYESRTKKELYELARKIDLPGRSNLKKQGLIKALRDQ